MSYLVSIMATTSADQTVRSQRHVDQDESKQLGVVCLSCGPMRTLQVSITFLQLDLAAVRGPQSVFPLLLSRGRVLVFSRRPSDDARLLDPEVVDLQDATSV